MIINFENYISATRTELEYYINMVNGYKINDTAFGVEFSIDGKRGIIEKLKHGYYINFDGVADYGTKREILNALESHWDGITLQ